MNGNIEYDNKYQRKIDSLLLSVGNKPLKNLNVDDFAGYMLKIQRNKKGNKSTSSYRIAAYSALKKYGKYLVASNQIEKNPMDFIERPKPIEFQETIEKREIGYLTKKEISKYVESVECGSGTKRSINRQKEWKERDLAIVMIFLNTGIRCSALMKIDIDNIDFIEKTLTVTDKESYVNKYELSDELLEIINLWIVKRKELLKGKETDALFISNRRNRMDQCSIYKVVNKYSSGIKGKHITPHKLRATYGTQLYDETKDIYFVQNCMKHANPKTTELYIRGTKNQTKTASEIMRKLTIK